MTVATTRLGRPHLVTPVAVPTVGPGTAAQRTTMDETSEPTTTTTTTTPDPHAPGDRWRGYPVVLVLEGAPCLVVGAGPLAARKVQGLLDSGAAVTVVAPRIGPEVRTLAESATSSGTLAVEDRPYRPPEASSYRFVVSATGDPDVDARVTADALAGGALVNRADSAPPRDDRPAPAAGTVLLPAVHRDGPVTVAVSTGGSSPALARWLRDRVAASLGPDLVVLAELVDDARRSLLDSARTGAAVDWSATLDRVAPLVANGQVAEARRLLADLTGAGPRATLRSPPTGR